RRAAPLRPAVRAQPLRRQRRPRLPARAAARPARSPAPGRRRAVPAAHRPALRAVLSAAADPPLPPPARGRLGFHLCPVALRGWPAQSAGTRPAAGHRAAAGETARPGAVPGTAVLRNRAGALRATAAGRPDLRGGVDPAAALAAGPPAGRRRA